MSMIKIITLTIYRWLWSIYKIASKRDLTFDDLCQMSSEDDPKLYAEQLESSWINEQESSKLNGQRPNLARALMNTSYGSFLRLTSIVVISECVTTIVQPLAIGVLTQYFSDRTSVTKQTATIAATFLVLSYVTRLIVDVYYNVVAKRLGAR